LSVILNAELTRLISGLEVIGVAKVLFFCPDVVVLDFTHFRSLLFVCKRDCDGYLIFCTSWEGCLLFFLLNLPEASGFSLTASRVTFWLLSADLEVSRFFMFCLCSSVDLLRSGWEPYTLDLMWEGGREVLRTIKDVDTNGYTYCLFFIPKSSPRCFRFYFTSKIFSY
jgi:hypothetical protein